MSTSVFTWSCSLNEHTILGAIAIALPNNAVRVVNSHGNVMEGLNAQLILSVVGYFNPFRVSGLSQSYANGS